MVKRYKKEDERSYALGAALTFELLNARPDAARCVYVTPRSNVTALTDTACALGVPVVESEKAFNILSPKENCYVIGEFEKFACELGEARDHIVLVNPSDSGNLGTIMREAAAFECELAIIRPAVDPFDPRTVRASMGAVFDIPFKCFDSFEDYLRSHGNRSVMPFMLDGAPFGETSFRADRKYALVFGNEATGLPQRFAKYGGVRIEQSPKIDSLNLSVAASIALYKLYTSRKKK